MKYPAGKLPAINDPRTLQARRFIQNGRGISAPSKWFADDWINLGNLPTPMFKNDRYGCCVIASGTHMAIRFQAAENHVIELPTDETVISQYLDESNGSDNGLIMLQSLNRWRKQGRRWVEGNHYIDSYLNVNATSKEEIMAAAAGETGKGFGLYTGVMLPESCYGQFDRNKPWAKTICGSKKGSGGGHAMWLKGYDVEYVYLATWGRVQKATWWWFLKYVDEAYIVLDAKDAKNQARALGISHNQLTEAVEWATSDQNRKVAV